VISSDVYDCEDFADFSDGDSVFEVGDSDYEQVENYGEEEHSDGLTALFNQISCYQQFLWQVRVQMAVISGSQPIWN
jgi:hypothetical protein